MTETQPNTRHLGYARVSTYGQMLEARLAQLKAQGCSKIYREKASGAQADRRELLKRLKAIAPGDVMTVTRIGRLACLTFDLFAIVKQIVAAGSKMVDQGKARALVKEDASTSGTLGDPGLGGLGVMSSPVASALA